MGTEEDTIKALSRPSINEMASIVARKHGETGSEYVIKIWSSCYQSWNVTLPSAEYLILYKENGWTFDEICKASFIAYYGRDITKEEIKTRRLPFREMKDRLSEWYKTKDLIGVKAADAKPDAYLQEHNWTLEEFQEEALFDSPVWK